MHRPMTSFFGLLALAWIGTATMPANPGRSPITASMMGSLSPGPWRRIPISAVIALRGEPISAVEFLETGDPLTTNICFGGEDLRTAYITCSGTGRLLATDWPRPGLQMAFHV